MSRPEKCLLDLTLTLPDELLQLVLSRVPAYDLVVSVRLVCRRWHCLLSDPSLWRRVCLAGRVGREHEVCCVLRHAPALEELVLFLDDRVPTRCPGRVLHAIRGAVANGCDVRRLGLDWRHFVADSACFHGILEALRDVVRDLDVGLVGVEPVAEPAATTMHPRPAAAFAALASMSALKCMRLRALFDPCWYFGELQAGAPRHALSALDVIECEPYLTRLLSDLLTTHGPTLRVLRLSVRVLATRQLDASTLPSLEHLTIDVGHQDSAVSLRGGTPLHVGRLTLARVNRRLPVPSQDGDEPSEAVRTACQLPWPSLHTLVLQDCLLSPADMAHILRCLGSRLQQLAIFGGCFLGTAQTMSAPMSSALRLRIHSLRFCPRDTETGLYPLAIEQQ